MINLMFCYVLPTKMVYFFPNSDDVANSYGNL